MNIVIKKKYWLAQDNLIEDSLLPLPNPKGIFIKLVFILGGSLETQDCIFVTIKCVQITINKRDDNGNNVLWKLTVKHMLILNYPINCLKTSLLSHIIMTNDDAIDLTLVNGQNLSILS